MGDDAILHAGLIALRVDGRWAGALLQGPSGSGKSDLALRALAAGWRLVADDRVRVWRIGASLYGAAPQRLAGLMEVRGLGVLPTAALPFARIRLLAEAPAPGGPPERMPEPRLVTLAEVALPRLSLSLVEASAPAKLRLALHAAAREDV